MALSIIWSPEARADVRAIDRETAMTLLRAIGRYLKTEAGDVKQLKSFDPPLFRLRIGDWRAVYRRREGDAIEIVRVRHRRDAYRD